MRCEAREKQIRRRMHHTMTDVLGPRNKADRDFHGNYLI
jgi:hypothetical protein